MNHISGIIGRSNIRGEPSATVYFSEFDQEGEAASKLSQERM